MSDPSCQVKRDATGVGQVPGLPEKGEATREAG